MTIGWTLKTTDNECGHSRHTDIKGHSTVKCHVYAVSTLQTDIFDIHLSITLLNPKADTLSSSKYLHKKKKKNKNYFKFAHTAKHIHPDIKFVHHIIVFTPFFR